MSSLAKISTGNEEVTGKIVITYYGMKRLLERVENGADFTPLNLAQIGIGNKISTTYGPSIALLRNEVCTFDINPDDIVLKGDICSIKCGLVITSGVTMKEIGVYEVINGKRYLFAYASGFSMVANDNLSYDLVIDLALKIAFKDVDYHEYEVSIGDVEYAHYPDIMNLYDALSNVELDLERCIQANANKIGFNKAEVFYKERVRISGILQNILMFTRYQRLISAFNSNDITDCFYYPETTETSYNIRNLCHEDSYLSVTKNLHNANKDYIDLSKPATILWTGTIDSLEKDGVIFAKSDPDKDHHYCDFRIWSDDVTDGKTKKGESGSTTPEVIKVLKKEQDDPETFVILDVESLEDIDIDTLEFNTYYYIPRLQAYYSIIIADIKDDHLHWINIAYNAEYPERENNHYYNVGDRVNINGYSFEVSSIINEHYLQFTIYSHNYDLAQKVDSHTASEFDIVGHYRIICRLTDEQKQKVIGHENTYIFTFNGDGDNPKIDFYIGSTKMDVVDDNFNFYKFPTEEEIGAMETGGDESVNSVDSKVVAGFYKALKESCTLKNYTCYLETVPYSEPAHYGGASIDSYIKRKYYVLDGIHNTSMLVFSKVLTAAEIQYIALISQG